MKYAEKGGNFQSALLSRHKTSQPARQKQDLTEPASPKAAPRPADGVIFSAFSFFASKTSSALRVCFLFYRYFMQKKAQKYPAAAGVSCPIRLRGFISLF
jgi:hypothetical protein